MKKIKAFLVGILAIAGLISSNNVFAQQDTIPNRRDSSRQHRQWDSTRQNRNSDSMRQNRNWDSTKNNNRWDRNTARSNENMSHTYIDLNTGDTLDYFYDTERKTVMNRTSNAPVDFYINTYTGDTVYGRGRFIVNGFLLQGDDGKWKFDESKVKVDGDEIKLKDGKRKLKI